MLWKHWQEEHRERKTAPVYTYNLLSRHTSATEMQVREALAISNSKADIIMNSKSEFGRNSLVTTAAEYDGKNWQTEKRVEEDMSSSPRRKRKKTESVPLEADREKTRNVYYEERLPDCTENPVNRFLNSRTGASRQNPQRNGLENWLRKTS